MSHLDTVRAERAKYGTPLLEKGAFAVTNATAYTWRAEGWGLLAKTAGTNYQGYSIDILLNVQTREAIDCLISSETEGIPTWSPIAWEERFASLWRAPLPPEGEPLPPIPPTDLEARVAALETTVRYLQEAAHRVGAIWGSV